MPAMRSTQTKYWCFTSYETEEPPYDSSSMTYLIAGRETCPDTGNKHWQCYLELEKKQRLSYFKNHDYYKHVHLEPRKGTALEASDYCKKEDPNPIIHGNISKGAGARNDIHDAVTVMQNGMSLSQLMFDPDHMQVVARNMQYFRSVWNTILSTRTMEELRQLYSNAVFRPWQEELITYVNAPVHPRQVLWYVDETGNQGKSWMASYLSSTAGALVLTNGKIQDIAHVYNNEKIVIFDLSRSQTECLNHIYTLMECFKNGRIFSPKYDSINKTFSPCHVIIFANFIPDHSKLSQDRWLVKTL
jgi:hypothetical protein